jgi:CheY-like chemotaxis protein
MKSVAGLRALVVEDDRVIQAVIKANLESIGIPTVVAGNGIEAIAAIKADTFDFVLMDIRMPDEDGLDATRWIRDEEIDNAVRHVPIFALTTYDSTEHTQEILDAGMDEHMVKPFKLDTFLRILDKYFPGAITG